MESTKEKFLSYDEICSNIEKGEPLNPIDKFIYEWEPQGRKKEDQFRTLLFDAINHENEEERTERNIKTVSAFMEHYKDETGNELEESVFLSFFNA